ncbi:patched domain-containing protein 3 [Oryzias melastigma]|uniref:Patched domain containing 3/pseudo n=1 Tax=Oryzias melastigma TaxID=30732 RepID=A0A3B3CVN6_ORYME|nr:patched domain-containing protein 3 [Oryzias melastigma]
MGCRRTDCLSKPLSGLFAKLGSAVGSHPLFFFIIPIVVSAALGAGFVFLKENEDNDFESQFTPLKGPSKVTRALVKENFPYDDGLFSEERLYSTGRFASLIVVATNVLDSPALEELIRLNEKVLNITVDVRRLGFTDVCARVERACASNVILEIMTSRKTSISYPEHIHGSETVFLGSTLGGVTTDANGTVTSAQAVRLTYFLDSQEGSAEAAKLWLRRFKALMGEEPSSENVDVSYFTSKSKQDEINSHTTDGFPLFLITYAFAISFSVISCMRFDNVRNKVWVAVFGVISSGLAVVSSFGLMLYIGVPFVITVANSPFLILGIGLNNMFILVSDWQHSHVKASVPERMAHTYEEAVMSITITALTDVLKFFIGVMSDFPAVQSFCLYTATSIFFCYIYTVTFLGAFMAVNGKREAGNRHWLTCMEIPSVKAVDQPDFYNFCCVGGDYDEVTGAEKKKLASNFFKDCYGPFLVKSWVKGLVVLIYLVYLAMSVFGCFNIQQGIELYDLAADNSHVTTFVKKERQFFSGYGPSIMVIVNEEFPYWDDVKRCQLQGCLEDFKEPQFVDEEISTSWLDSFLLYGQERRLNLNDREAFLSNLTEFLEHAPIFKQDVNLTGAAITASRFFIQTVDIANASIEIEMLQGLKSIAGSCSAASLTVYNKDFIYFDQYDVVVKSIIKNVAVISAVMLVVSLLLIPDPVCALLVTCSIGSVTAGVTGFMALWDISLDSISMIIFTVCIGFTVDFSAHVSYAFASSRKDTPNEKAVEALSNLGYPILQGTLSTILGLSVLLWSEFHTFRTFFQIFFLVMFIGMVHGLVFIPVILTLFTCSSREKKSEKDLQMTRM